MLNTINQGNANENHNITPHLLKWLSSKRQEITNADEDVEKREPCCTVGGNVNCYSQSAEKIMEIPQKTRTCFLLKGVTQKIITICRYIYFYKTI